MWRIGQSTSFKPCLDGTLANLLALLVITETLDVRVRAKIQIDLVGIVDGLLGQVLGAIRVGKSPPTS